MIAGVDGCKEGWVVAIGEGWRCEGRAKLIFCADFGSVVEATSSCEAVVVDMPIGIPPGAECRDCDVQAREMLGSGGSRVFPTPPRESLVASTYQEFLARHKELRGKGVSKQTCGIVPKIKEVDAVMTVELQDRVFEFHPEVAWKYVAGRTLESKHNVQGILERLEIVERCAGGVGRFVREGDIRAAKVDDVLDAIVGLSVADAIAEGPDYNRRLPEREPPRDARGLRMEIWY